MSRLAYFSGLLITLNALSNDSMSVINEKDENIEALRAHAGNNSTFLKKRFKKLQSSFDKHKPSTGESYYLPLAIKAMKPLSPQYTEKAKKTSLPSMTNSVISFSETNTWYKKFNDLKPATNTEINRPQDTELISLGASNIVCSNISYNSFYGSGPLMIKLVSENDKKCVLQYPELVMAARTQPTICPFKSLSCATLILKSKRSITTNLRLTHYRYSDTSRHSSHVF